MSRSASNRFFAIAIALCASCTCVRAGDAGALGIGKVATQQEIAGWDIDVRGDDGVGLPAGKGTVDNGAEVYMTHCAACHGTFGEGVDRYPKLMGGNGTLTADRPEPTVGSYWPYAPTLWDYINRAMPLSAPHSLSADDVYAITAYVLNFNGIVPNDFVADRNSLPKVKMPNRDNFTWGDPRPDTVTKPCMKNCVDPKSVKIIYSAEGQELTPRTTGPLDKMQAK
jgi:S-disulfanyl-L-cysteine oxidoreductase SoxD